MYIAECAKHLKVGSIQRRLNAIAAAHKTTGLESPTHSAIVANTMKGIRRTKGTAQIQKAPTLTEDIRAMVDATDAGVIGARDRALILLGFFGAFRRSELVGFDAEDCAFGKDGLSRCHAIVDFFPSNQGRPSWSATFWPRSPAIKYLKTAASFWSAACLAQVAKVVAFAVNWPRARTKKPKATSE